MSGRLPREFIDQLLSRIDVVEVVDRCVPLKKAGKDFKACCPFHDEKTPSFTVSPSKQFYHCFGCGASGTAITFVMEFNHLGFREAVEDLANAVGLPIPDTGLEHQDNDTPRLLEHLEEAKQFYKRQLRSAPGAEAAIAYLKQRGISGEVAAEFEIGYAPDDWQSLADTAAGDSQKLTEMTRAGLISQRETGGHYDRFRSRIVFPIDDRRGRTVAFGGRIIGQGEPKYLNSAESPVFNKSAELYHLHQARAAIAKQDEVLVVEGYLDVIALVQYGVDNTVATLGTATTPLHLQQLFRLTSSVVFCFDGDRAGRTAAWRALQVALSELRDGRQASFLFLPEGEDPDSLIRAQGADTFRLLVDKATPLPDFLFENLAGETDLSRMDGRARLVALATPLLEKIPQGPLLDLMQQRLTELSGVRTGPTSLTNKPARPKTTRTQPDKRLTPLATAISLLIQHPSLASEGPLPALDKEGDDARGLDLLITIDRVARSEPNLSTAGVVERFRDDKDFLTLEKLAVHNHHLDDNRLVEFYQQTLATLEEQQVSAHITALLARSDSQEESATYRERLASLFKRQQSLRQVRENR
ncbi:MAG TPA: DNA primase [Gammaproteobacteria bacterium]|nr:DNA primase [Gammaproteobacteria bacterium]